MTRRPQRSTRTDTPCPYTTRFRSIGDGTALNKNFSRLVKGVREGRPDKLQEETTRMRLAQIELDLEVMRALTLTNASIVARGDTPTMEASMAKVWTTELRRSEDQTSELQSLMRISYAVFCFK